MCAKIERSWTDIFIEQARAAIKLEKKMDRCKKIVAALLPNK